MAETTGLKNRNREPPPRESPGRGFESLSLRQPYSRNHKAIRDRSSRQHRTRNRGRAVVGIFNHFPGENLMPTAADPDPDRAARVRHDRLPAVTLGAFNLGTPREGSAHGVSVSGAGEASA